MVFKNKHRHSIRLPGYDYSQNGYYFVTVCAQNRVRLFGEIADGMMRSNEVGKMINEEWYKLVDRYSHITIDKFVVMPNHIHGIVIVGATLVVAHNIRAGTSPAPTPTSISLGQIIGAFKSITTDRYIQGIQNHGWTPFEKRFWQRNYYEHIIRNEKDYWAIRQYIENNPKNWEKDELFL